MKYRVSITEGEEKSDINISPLIDMVFILLIFFIVTTVFVEESGVALEKPSKMPSASLSDSKTVILSLTEGGKVLYNGNDISVGGVRALVARELQADDQTPVVLQMDDKVKAEQMVRVMDEAKQAGAKIISISPRT